MHTAAERVYMARLAKSINRRQMHFSKWFPLTEDGVDAKAPTGPAAVQLRTADGVIDYPAGKSAMVFYFFASTSVAEALRTHFADELTTPGHRGYGPLLFRFSDESDGAAGLQRHLDAFEARFGRKPWLHESDNDETAERH